VLRLGILGSRGDIMLLQTPLGIRGAAPQPAVQGPAAFLELASQWFVERDEPQGSHANEVSSISHEPST